MHIKFKLANRQQAKELFTKFYPASVRQNGTTQTQLLIDLLEEKFNYSEKAAAETAIQKHTQEGAFEPEGCSLTTAQLVKLAQQFAHQIPEHEFSMAALQGLLMQYKTRLHQAVDETSSWIALERKHKQDWEGVAVKATDN